MSKELKALERIRNVEVEIGNNHDTAVKVFNLTNEYDDCFKIIETALKDYEDLKERMGITDVVMEDFIKLWKEHKALEIIKEKRVDMDFLFEEWEEGNWGFALENYNMNHEIELTQEEYDLLKEVLK